MCLIFIVTNYTQIS
uniref:Uncharacterized protein n=1 Tax=Arundo donax TaxID=35708 RepID=A0A0A8YPK9_ARUDO